MTDGSVTAPDILRALERLEEDAPPRPFADAKGHSWRYRRIGTGDKAVFLLPGASGTSHFFFQQATGKADASLFLIDYPGAPEAEDLAEGIVALWDSLGVERASFVGCSYSAYWGQIVARRHPARLDRLILCTGFTDAGDLAGNPLFDGTAIAATEVEVLRRQWLERAGANPHPVLRTLLLGALREWLPAEDLKGRLLRVATATPVGPLPLQDDQVLILDCADDPLVPAPARDRFARGHGRFARKTLPSGGHYPYVTAPEEFGKTLERFLQIKT